MQSIVNLLRASSRKHPDGQSSEEIWPKLDLGPSVRFSKTMNALKLNAPMWLPNRKLFRVCNETVNICRYMLA